MLDLNLILAAAWLGSAFVALNATLCFGLYFIFKKMFTPRKRNRFGTYRS